MTLAVVMSRSLDGMQAPPVHVEVQLAPGLPSFTLVGLADTEVKEARERVRAALQQSGFGFPHNKRVTVNLAPAELPKESGRFDLPIALGILAAEGRLDAARLARFEFAGELSLAGELRPVRGALALALAARREGASRPLVLPKASAALAAHVPGVDVRAAVTLAEVAAAFALPAEGAAHAAEPPALPRAVAAPLPAAVPPAADLRDVRGQAAAKRALEIAAAGGHSLLLVGPPGAGKSMLAERLPGLLPPGTDEERLAAAALRGLTGRRDGPDGAPPAACPAFRAPHHTSTAAALVGGGSPPRPGEISLAHGGVLFLDELPEFPRSALEALREPLETGTVTISRAGRQAVFPARFQLVAAMNPCPCGWHGSRGAGRECRCTPDAVQRYAARLSGPLLDRIDLHVEVGATPASELLALPDGEPSVAVAARVAAARARAQGRAQDGPNAQLGAAAIERHAALDDAAARFLRQAAERLGFSARRVHRCQKVARTVADLCGSETIGVAHLAEALQLQRALAG